MVDEMWIDPSKGGQLSPSNVFILNGSHFAAFQRPFRYWMDECEWIRQTVNAQNPQRIYCVAQTPTKHHVYGKLRESIAFEERTATQLLDWLRPLCGEKQAQDYFGGFTYGI
jgi:hypothetical protein